MPGVEALLSLGIRVDEKRAWRFRRPVVVDVEPGLFAHPGRECEEGKDAGCEPGGLSRVGADGTEEGDGLAFGMVGVDEHSSRSGGVCSDLVAIA